MTYTGHIERLLFQGFPELQDEREESSFELEIDEAIELGENAGVRYPGAWEAKVGNDNSRGESVRMNVYLEEEEIVVETDYEGETKETRLDQDSPKAEYLLERGYHEV